MKCWITHSGTKITRILFGRSNVYLVSSGSSHILVDTGWGFEEKRLIRRLRQTGRPGAVVMTHTHFDHAGNAGALAREFSPAFIVHESEKGFLECGDSPIPQGTMRLTRFVRRLGADRVHSWFHVEGVNAGVTFDDRYDLSPLRIDGYVLHTPGHSRGSCCVIIDHEVALAGDTIDGMKWTIFPPWGDDPEGILASWKKLLDTGCRVFHPAHGLPVSRERLEKELLKKGGNRFG
jgi:hydroxyacylglutathione hydrolase